METKSSAFLNKHLDDNVHGCSYLSVVEDDSIHSDDEGNKIHHDATIDDGASSSENTRLGHGK